jgi:hypothetical protein
MFHGNNRKRSIRVNNDQKNLGCYVLEKKYKSEEGWDSMSNLIWKNNCKITVKYCCFSQKIIYALYKQSRLDWEKSPLGML